MPNILIQLAEALGTGGWVVVLLFLCGGSVWAVMAVRRNKEDHDRLEATIAQLAATLETSRKEARDEMQAWRKESREDRKEARDEMQAWRKEFREDRKEARDELQAWRKEAREDSKEAQKEMQAWRKEAREDSKEAQKELRTINLRLDGIIDRKPPDQTG